MYSVTCAHITCVCYIDETVRIYEIGVHLRTYGVRGCDFACTHSFAPDVDISRPHARVSSVLALETRSTSSRESVRDVERDDARNRARASRARARDPFHSFVPAVRRDNSSGRLDLPTRWVDAREG